MSAAKHPSLQSVASLALSLSSFAGS